MKYFATQIRPCSFEDFKFRKYGIYEITPEKALDLYQKYCKSYGDAQHEAKMLWESGETIIYSSILIYGMIWDDKKLFIEKLKGEICAEILQ